MSAPIEYFNRYSGRVEVENVYGGGFLRWTYHSSPGRAALHALVKHAAFSRLYGWLMDSAGSTRKIRPFIEKYHLDTSDFACAPDEFASFNEFFHRALRPGARPIADDPDAAVFPADGRHLGFQDVSKIDGVFLKGQRFDLVALLSDAALAARYSTGSLVLSRLCPVDYHRFHFPVRGIAGESRLIDGPLFSVNPIALRRHLAYLWENKRVLTELRSERFGLIQLIEVGATNVGSIVQTYRPGEPVTKGTEKGYFRFGGSSTITLFEPDRIELAADLIAQTVEFRELYAHVGDAMGKRAGTVSRPTA
jgi:phosphatidylserine decarboxylase